MIDLIIFKGGQLLAISSLVLSTIMLQIVDSVEPSLISSVTDIATGSAVISLLLLAVYFLRGWLKEERETNKEHTQKMIELIKELKEEKAMVSTELRVMNDRLKDVDADLKSLNTNN